MFDWDAAKNTELKPGIYQVEVVACTPKTSQSGNRMWSVRLHAVEFDAMLCYDNMMLTGKGAGMTAAKLELLGFARGSQVDAPDLVGRRAWVSVLEKEYNGKVNLAVDISAPGSKCGYFAVEPAGVMKPEEPPF